MTMTEERKQEKRFLWDSVGRVMSSLSSSRISKAGMKVGKYGVVFSIKIGSLRRN